MRMIVTNPAERIDVPGFPDRWAYVSGKMLRLDGVSTPFYNMAEIVASLTHAQQQAAERRAAAAAQKTPTPQETVRGFLAYLGEDGKLIQVTIRGRHARTNELLITWPSGRKDSASESTVLRDLTADEQAALVDVLTEQYAAYDAVRASEGTRYSDVTAAGPEEVECRYDPAGDCWVWVTPDGNGELRAPSADALKLAISEYYLVPVYPFVVVRGAILEGWHNSDTDRFRTREDAAVWIENVQRRRAADDALMVLKRKLRFPEESV